MPARLHPPGKNAPPSSPSGDAEADAEAEAAAAAGAWSREAERRRLIAWRVDLPDALRAEYDERIIDHLRVLLRDLFRGRLAKVGGFWPIHGEPDLRPLFHELTKGGHRIGLPLVDRVQRPLTFVHWKPTSAMAPGVLGVPVPTSGNAVYVELLLVPCVGFAVGPDGKHHRLGYGGGYYDRTLAARRCKTVGIAYQSMRLDRFDADPHDMPLDYIVTEEGVQ